MKLKQRIAAVVTAFALMFTLTDPSALGGIFNSAGSAFAAAVGSITLLQKPAAPVAGTAFWDASSEYTKTDNDLTTGQILEKTVTWYLDGTDTVVTGNAGYNKKYRVEIKFRINTSNYNFSSDFSMQYHEGTSLKDLDFVFEGDDWAVAKMSFDATRMPNATKAEFIPTTTIPAGKQEITLSPSLACHATDSDILRALPSTALIKTEDDTLNLNATITWKTSTGAFDFVSSTYDPNDVEQQTFKIRGTVNVPSGSQVGNTTFFDYLYVNVTVLAADVLPKPTASTQEGEYNTGITVKLSSSEDIYYTISSNDKGADPQGGVETESNFKYNGGINLAGVVGSTKTYYIKAIAYNKNFRQSEVATFIYSITLEPSELTNIPTVHLDVDPPVGGKVLDTTAELSSDATDLERGGIAIISSVAWIGENVHGKADYNTRYSISIEITPKNMYAFFSTPDVYINGMEARSTTNSSGTLTITYTFTEKTEKLKSFKIVNPSTTVMAENGTSITNIGKLLPNMVEIEAPVGTLLEKEYPVAWDLSTSSPAYDPKMAEAQTFTLTGTVTMPDYIEYSHGQNTAKVTVYVGQAGMLTWPTASPADSAEGQRSFYEPVSVTLSSANANASIYYTIGTSSNISAPTVSGGKAYTSPIVLSGVPGEIVNYYIKAIATAAGMKDSPVNTFVYTVIIPKQTAETPTANYKTGNYQQSLEIALNTITVGAEIYYTTDPTAKKEAFKRYDGVFILEGQANSTKTYNVRCYAKDPAGLMNDSDIASFSYTITLPKNKALAPYTNYTPGVSYEKSIYLTLKSDTPNTEIYYTINSELDPEKGINGTKYTGKSIGLLEKKNEVVVYTIRAYAKSLDANVDSSAVVTYKFTIGVDYGVKSIEIEQRPMKYSYYLGELLNLTGGKLKVTYNDGRVESVYMEDEMIEDFDSWVIGQQSVTVYYKGCSTKFNIVVRKRSDVTDSGGSTSGSGNTGGNGNKDDNTDTDTSITEGIDDSDEETVSLPTIEGSTAKGWSQLKLKIKAADIGSRIVIYLNGNTSVPADIINTAISKKATLQFVVNDWISWVVDAGKLKKTVSSVSVGVKCKDVYIPSVLIDSSGDSEVVRMHVYGENKVGAVLYVRTGCKEANHFVNLFRYNEESHKLDFSDTSKVTANTGLAMIQPTVGGDYVLMLDTKTRLPGDANNSTDIDVNDAAAILKMMVGMMQLDDTCDFNNDGFIDVFDASAILKSIVGLK